MGRSPRLSCRGAGRSAACGFSCRAGYRRTYSSSRRQCGHSMIVVLLAWSYLTRAVLGMRCPHHEQKLYSSLAETMNTRRWRGGVGFPAASCLSSCLLSPLSLVSSSSRSAWIAHWPNVRSLPGATCRWRSNRYRRSSAAGREPACLSVSSAPVSRVACLYNRVICGPLLSSCGCSPRPAFPRRSVPLLAILRRGVRGSPP